MNLEPRGKRFLQGATFVLIPAALLIPAVAFFTLCPPAYARIVFTALLVVFAASEGLGLAKLYSCLARKLDMLTFGTMLCSVIGVSVLVVIVWGTLIHPSW